MTLFYKKFSDFGGRCRRFSLLMLLVSCGVKGVDSEAAPVGVREGRSTSEAGKPCENVKFVTKNGNILKV